MTNVEITDAIKQYLGGGSVHYDHGTWVFTPAILSTWTYRLTQAPKSGEWAGHLFTAGADRPLWTDTGVDLFDLLGRAPVPPAVPGIEEPPAPRPQATPDQVYKALRKRPDLLRAVIQAAVTNGDVQIVREWEDTHNEGYRYLLDADGTCMNRVWLNEPNQWRWQLNGHPLDPSICRTREEAQAAADTALLQDRPNLVLL